MFDMDNEMARAHSAILREELGAVLMSVGALSDGRTHNKSLIRATILRQRIDQLEGTNWRTYRPAPNMLEQAVAAARTAWQAITEAPLRASRPMHRPM